MSAWILVLAAFGIALSGCIAEPADVGQVPEGAHVCTDAEKQAQVCTMEYNPVCGDNGVTYSNGCVACSSGEIDYWVPGECS